MNEENVKLRVLNLLQNWGFETSELKLEESFTIKFGKGAARVDSLKSLSVANPRADILVTKDGQNLFIFEIKASDIEIDNEDIYQGISYARLTRQVTPYVVITNGKDTRVFNTYTDAELKLDDNAFTVQIKNFNYNLSLDLDIQELQYKATKYLVGMSPHNLAIFCNQQIDSRMNTLKGIDVNSDEKYIPEIFVKREAIYEDFEKFLMSDKTCFSIVGESGTGKTNVICDLALEYASDRQPDFLSYFYACHDLHNDIVENIKEDFNLHFTQQNSSEQIIKKLSDISDKKTIIFLDAVDEKNNNDFPLELNNFIRIAKDKDIKVCFTCKDIEFERFLNNGGNPTIISKCTYSNENNKQNNNISFSLDNFSDHEYEAIKSLYIEKYKLTDIPQVMDYDLKNGFILRIYAEVHRDGREFQAQNVMEMMQEYLEQKLAKMNDKKGDKEIAFNTLIETGKYIWQNSIGKDINLFPTMRRMSDKISENKLKEAMGLRFDEIIQPKLFEHKILQRNNYEELFVSFYYTRFRDFIIAFKYLNINTMSDGNFAKILPELYSSNIGISIVQWYSQFAKHGHKELINKYYLGKILSFITEYNALVDKYFKEIKGAIVPNLVDKIAIGLQKDPVHPFYFFYPAQNNADIMIIFDNHDAYDAAFRQIGGTSSTIHIDESTDSKVLAFTRLIDDVFWTLKKPYEGGFGDFNSKCCPKSKLSIGNNPIILNEKAYSIFDKYSHLLGYKNQIKLKESNFSYKEYKPDVFPLLIDDILNSIHKFKIKVFLENQDSDFNTTTFSYRMCDEAIEYDNENAVNQFLEMGKELPEIKIEDIDFLCSLLDSYKKYSNTLDSPLPREDLREWKPLEIWESIDGEPKTRFGEDIPCDIYSKKQRNEYYKQWFTKKYHAYIAYIEQNFPNVKQYMRAYSNLPASIQYNIEEGHDRINNSLYCVFHYEILTKQKHSEPIKMVETEIFNTKFVGWRIMPPHPDTIEENAIRLLGDDLKEAVKKIAEEENIEIPKSFHMPSFI